VYGLISVGTLGFISVGVGTVALAADGVVDFVGVGEAVETVGVVAVVATGTVGVTAGATGLATGFAIAFATGNGGGCEIVGKGGGCELELVGSGGGCWLADTTNASWHPPQRIVLPKNSLGAVKLAEHFGQDVFIDMKIALLSCYPQIRRQSIVFGIGEIRSGVALSSLK
jgi:hypothetical protein